MHMFIALSSRKYTLGGIGGQVQPSSTWLDLWWHCMTWHGPLFGKSLPFFSHLYVTHKCWFLRTWKLVVNYKISYVLRRYNYWSWYKLSTSFMLARSWLYDSKTMIARLLMVSVLLVVNIYCCDSFVYILAWVVSGSGQGISPCLTMPQAKCSTYIGGDRTQSGRQESSVCKTGHTLQSVIPRDYGLARMRI